MKCSHVPDIEALFSKREKGKTIAEEGSGIYNNNVLFLWKCQVQEMFVFLCVPLRGDGRRELNFNGQNPLSWSESWST